MQRDPYLDQQHQLPNLDVSYLRTSRVYQQNELHELTMDTDSRGACELRFRTQNPGPRLFCVTQHFQSFGLLSSLSARFIVVVTAGMWFLTRDLLPTNDLEP